MQNHFLQALHATFLSKHPMIHFLSTFESPTTTKNYTTEIFRFATYRDPTEELAYVSETSELPNSGGTYRRIDEDR